MSQTAGGAPAPPARFVYEGPVYVRPLGRGVWLGDDQLDPDDGRYLDQVVADLVHAGWREWQGHLRITIEVMPPGARPQDPAPSFNEGCRWCGQPAQAVHRPGCPALDCAWPREGA